MKHPIGIALITLFLACPVLAEPPSLLFEAEVTQAVELAIEGRAASGPSSGFTLRHLDLRIESTGQEIRSCFAGALRTDRSIQLDLEQGLVVVRVGDRLIAELRVSPQRAGFGEPESCLFHVVAVLVLTPAENVGTPERPKR